MSQPWMPLYVADYLADTRHLSAAEHGAYLLLIMHYWQNGSLPADEDRLARIACLSQKEWLASRSVLSEFFDQQWRHARIDRELLIANDKYCRRVAAGRKGGLAKANGKQNASNATSKTKAGLYQSQSQSHSPDGEFPSREEQSGELGEIIPHPHARSGGRA